MTEKDHNVVEYLWALHEEIWKAIIVSAHNGKVYNSLVALSDQLEELIKEIGTK